MDFYTTAILQGLGFCFLGVGIYLTLRIFNIPDITTDGSYTCGGAVTAVLLMNQVHPLIVLPAAAAAGMVSGILTGLIHVHLKVPALLAGILVMTALYSVNLSVMGRSNIPLLETETVFGIFGFTATGPSGPLPVLGIFVAWLFAFMVWILHTDFGIAMRATGSNETMVRSVGVNTGRMKITGLALANGLTAISGYLLVQYQGFCDINMGIGIVISGLASVIIGGSLVRLTGRSRLVFEIAGVIVGTVLFRLILAGALTAGIDPNYLKLITAMLVLVVIALGVVFKKGNA